MKNEMWGGESFGGSSQTGAGDCFFSSFLCLIIVL